MKSGHTHTWTKCPLRPSHDPSPSTDLLVLSCRVQVQLSIRANALRQQRLGVSQPLTQVIHVTVELPPLFDGTIKTPIIRKQTKAQSVSNMHLRQSKWVKTNQSIPVFKDKTHHVHQLGNSTDSDKEKRNRRPLLKTGKCHNNQEPLTTLESSQ